MKYDNFTEELLLSFAIYVYAPTSLRYRNTTADSMQLPGNSILDLAKASTSGAQQNCLCQTPLTSLSIINLLRFGLETAIRFIAGKRSVKFRFLEAVSRHQVLVTLNGHRTDESPAAG